MDKIDFIGNGGILAVNHTVCAAFAKGKSVQYKESGKWYDYDSKNASELFGPWCYRSDILGWRVKPDTVTIVYRVALMKDTSSDIFYTLTADKDNDIGYAESELESVSNFVMWLGEAVTKEIEIG